MTVDGNDFLVQYRGAVERRVHEQIARHQNVDPHADPRRTIEIQMRQEREELERLIQKDDTISDVAKALRQIIAWLPEFERTLKGR